jgi:hypothetical protein
MSRAGRHARMQRLIAAGLWDGPGVMPPKPRRRAPEAKGLRPFAGGERLAWLWAHRNDGHPRIAMLICWQRGLEAIAAEGRARREEDAA